MLSYFHIQHLIGASYYKVIRQDPCGCPTKRITRFIFYRSTNFSILNQWFLTVWLLLFGLTKLLTHSYKNDEDLKSVFEEELLRIGTEKLLLKSDPVNSYRLWCNQFIGAIYPWFRPLTIPCTGRRERREHGYTNNYYIIIIWSTLKDCMSIILLLSKWVKGPGINQLTPLPLWLSKEWTRELARVWTQRSVFLLVDHNWLPRRLVVFREQPGHFL